MKRWLGGGGGLEWLLVTVQFDFWDLSDGLFGHQNYMILLSYMAFVVDFNFKSVIRSFFYESL